MSPPAGSRLAFGDRNTTAGTGRPDRLRAAAVADIEIGSEHPGKHVHAAVDHVPGVTVVTGGGDAGRAGADVGRLCEPVTPLRDRNARRAPLVDQRAELWAADGEELRSMIQRCASEPVCRQASTGGTAAFEQRDRQPPVHQ